MNGPRPRLSVLLVAALLLTRLPATLSAQDGRLPGVAGARYVSPTYGFALSWDESWQVEAATSANGVDSLRLDNGTSRVAFLAYPFAGDPTACVQARAAQLQTDPAIAGLTPALDGNGQPLAGSDELGAYATYNYAAAEGGEARSVYLDCRPLPIGGAVLLIEQDVPQAAYNDQLVARRTVIDSLIVTPIAGNEPLPSEPSSAAPARSTEVDRQLPALRWRLSGRLAGVENGVAYVVQVSLTAEASIETIVAAVDGLSGRQLWETRFPDTGWALVAVEGGLVCAQVGIGELVALDAATGEERWRWQAPRSTNTEWSAFSRPTVADGLVILDEVEGETLPTVDGAVGRVHALDAATGRHLWQAETAPMEGYALPVVDGTVYVADLAGDLHAIDAAAGSHRWRTNTGANGISAPLVADGTVYDWGFTTTAAGEEDWYFYAVDAATGQERWRVPTGGLGPAVPQGWISAEEIQPPVVTDELVYVLGVRQGPADSVTLAIDVATGQVRWRLDGPTAWRGGQLTATGDTVYVASIFFEDERGTSLLTALDAATGTERWRWQPSQPGNDLTAPLVGDGVAYLGDGQDLVAVGAADGGELWRARGGGRVTSVRHLEDGVLYLTDYEFAYALDLEASTDPTEMPAADARHAEFQEDLLISTHVSFHRDGAVAGLWRVTYVPGASAPLPFVEWGIAAAVEAGSIDLSMAVPVTVEGAFAEERSVIGTGDEFRPYIWEPVTATNTGTAPAELLVGAVVPPDAVGRVADQPGLTIQPVVGVSLDETDLRAALDLHRVTIAPGGSLPTQLALQPEVLVVESGALGVLVDGADAAITRAGSDTPTTETAFTLRPGDRAELPVGIWRQAANANADPLVVLVLDVRASTREYQFAAAGCGGRCLSFRRASP